MIEPHKRLKEQVGEQANVLLLALCGSALAFKAFTNIGQRIATAPTAPYAIPPKRSTNSVIAGNNTSTATRAMSLATKGRTPR